MLVPDDHLWPGDEWFACAAIYGELFQTKDPALPDVQKALAFVGESLETLPMRTCEAVIETRSTRQMRHVPYHLRDIAASFTGRSQCC